MWSVLDLISFSSMCNNWGLPLMDHVSCCGWCTRDIIYVECASKEGATFLQIHGIAIFLMHSFFCIIMWYLQYAGCIRTYHPEWSYAGCLDTWLDIFYYCVFLKYIWCWSINMSNENFSIVTQKLIRTLLGTNIIFTKLLTTLRELELILKGP